MKYEQMTLAMLKAITERAIIDRDNTADVELMTINFDFDDEDETFEDDDTGHLCQNLSVCALVDEEETDYTLAWDTEDDKFVMVRNENEADEWAREREELFGLMASESDINDVIETFGLQECDIVEVTNALDELDDEWKAIDKDFEGKDEEETDEGGMDKECRQNRAVCTCQLKLRKMRRVLDTYEQTRCNVNRQFSWWVDGRATTDEVMAELGIIRDRKSELEQILNTFKEKLAALGNTEGLEPGDKQQKRWAIYAETRHELGYQ